MAQKFKNISIFLNKKSYWIFSNATETSDFEKTPQTQKIIGSRICLQLETLAAREEQN